MKITTPILENNIITNSFEFILEKGERKGEKYEAYLNVPCDNPTCNCGCVVISIYALDEKNTTVEETKSDYQFGIDVVEKCLDNHYNKGISIRNANFAKAFLKEVTINEWSNFKRYFESYKSRLTAECDIDTLDVSFPKEIEKGQMHPYAEVFPFGKQMILNDKGSTYIMDDHYCLKPTCRCTDALLTFLEVKNNKVNYNRTFAIRFNYEKNSFTIEGKISFKKEEIDPIVEGFKTQILKYASELKQRHSNLRKLYLKFKNKK